MGCSTCGKKSQILKGAANKVKMAGKVAKHPPVRTLPSEQANKGTSASAPVPEEKYLHGNVGTPGAIEPVTTDLNKK